MSCCFPVKKRGRKAATGEGKEEKNASAVPTVDCSQSKPAATAGRDCSSPSKLERGPSVTEQPQASTQPSLETAQSQGQRNEHQHMPGNSSSIDAGNGDGARQLHHVPGTEVSIMEGILHANLRVDFEDLTFHELIGKGSSKTVYRGRWNSTMVAIVCMRRGGIVNEARFLQLLRNHPNLVQFYRWAADDSGNEYILLELVRLGSLDKLLFVHGSSIRTRDRLAMCEQICGAMCELAEGGVLHRDLSARNVLVQSMDPVHVKVADLGLAYVAPESSVLSGGDLDACVPVRWTAPEVLLRGECSQKSDVWSYGVTLWEIFTNGSEPYASKTDQEVMEAVIGGEILPQPEGCPSELYGLMKWCWRQDPNERPTFQEIAQQLRQWRKEHMLQANMDKDSSKELVAAQTAQSLPPNQQRRHRQPPIVSDPCQMELVQQHFRSLQLKLQQPNLGRRTSSGSANSEGHKDLQRPVVCVPALPHAGLGLVAQAGAVPVPSSRPGLEKQGNGPPDYVPLSQALSSSKGQALVLNMPEGHVGSESRREMDLVEGSVGSGGKPAAATSSKEEDGSNVRSDSLGSPSSLMLSGLSLTNQGAALPWVAGVDQGMGLHALITDLGAPVLEQGLATQAGAAVLSGPAFDQALNSQGVQPAAGAPGFMFASSEPLPAMLLTSADSSNSTSRLEGPSMQTLIEQPQQSDPQQQQFESKVVSHSVASMTSLTHLLPHADHQHAFANKQPQPVPLLSPALLLPVAQPMPRTDRQHHGQADQQTQPQPGVPEPAPSLTFQPAFLPASQPGLVPDSQPLTQPAWTPPSQTPSLTLHPVQAPQPAQMPTLQPSVPVKAAPRSAFAATSISGFPGQLPPQSAFAAASRAGFSHQSAPPQSAFAAASQPPLPVQSQLSIIPNILSMPGFGTSGPPSPQSPSLTIEDLDRHKGSMPQAAMSYDLDCCIDPMMSSSTALTEIQMPLNSSGTLGASYGHERRPTGISFEALTAECTATQSSHTSASHNSSGTLACAGSSNLSHARSSGLRGSEGFAGASAAPGMASRIATPQRMLQQSMLSQTRSQHASPRRRSLTNQPGRQGQVRSTESGTHLSVAEQPAAQLASLRSPPEKQKSRMQTSLGTPRESFASDMEQQVHAHQYQQQQQEQQQRDLGVQQWATAVAMSKAGEDGQESGQHGLQPIRERSTKSSASGCMSEGQLAVLAGTHVSPGALSTNASQQYTGRTHVPPGALSTDAGRQSASNAPLTNELLQQLQAQHRQQVQLHHSQQALQAPQFCEAQLQPIQEHQAHYPQQSMVQQQPQPLPQQQLAAPVPGSGYVNMREVIRFCNKAKIGC